MKTYLIFGTLLGAALALLGPLATEGRGDFILYGSETLTVSTSHTCGYLWDTSHAWVVSGGWVKDSLFAYDSSTVHLSGGAIETMDAYNSSVVDISSGDLSQLYAHDTSTVDISGGGRGPFFAYDSSTVHISGGTVSYLRAYGSSTVDICDGSVGYGGSLDAYDSSAVDISGGSVSSLAAGGASTVTFHGRNFRLSSGLSLEGDRVIGTGSLTGEWMDGTRWGVNIERNDPGAYILVVPEPATLALLALGGLAVLRRRAK